MRRRTSAPERVLATVMFTDIVGSTERAAEVGDKRWRALLARHHAIVRGELRRFGGREIDTAGDGFFAAFDRPAQAIECAAAVRSKVGAPGLEIRAAIHMGECEVMGSKLGGITVHAAARVLALAEPGQILVTGTIRDLTAGSDILYEERGVHELKGLPGEWRVLSVERMARDEVIEEPATQLEERAAPRRGTALVGIAALVVAAVVAGVLIARRDSARVEAAPNSVVRIDPVSNEVAAAAAVGDPTVLSVAEDGVVWVGTGDNTLQAIDPNEGAVRKTIGLPGPPTGIAATPGSVWVTFGFGAQGSGDETLQRVSTTSDTIEDRIALGHGVDAIVADGGSVWVLDEPGETVTSIDANGGTVIATGKTGVAPRDLALGGGSVWVANRDESSVWQLDAGTLERTGEAALTIRPSHVEFGFDRVWVASILDQKIAVIDASDLSIVATLPLKERPSAMAIGDEEVWLVGERGGLFRIDTRSLKVTSVTELPGVPYDLAASEAGLWLALGR